MCFILKYAKNQKAGEFYLSAFKNCMIFKKVYTMFGMTVWGIRNVVPMIELITHSCFSDGKEVEHYGFWLANFMVVSFYALALAIISIVVFPMWTLHNIYKGTARKQDGSTPYAAGNVTTDRKGSLKQSGYREGSIISVTQSNLARRYSTPVADTGPVQLKEETTLTDIHEALVDVLILNQWPRPPYKFYKNGQTLQFYGQKTQEGLRRLVRCAKLKCVACSQRIKSI